MKTRERLKELRQSKSFASHEKLVKDYWPGTQFDALIEYVTWHHGELEKLRAEGKAERLPRAPEAYRGEGFDFARYHAEVLQEFGESIVQIISARDAQPLKDLARAIDAWRNHKPEPDNLRAEIEKYFQCNQQRYWREGGNSPKIQPVTMRGLIAHLINRRVADDTEGWRRHVREVCGKMNRPISGEPGCPKKTGGKSRSDRSR